MAGAIRESGHLSFDQCLYEASIRVLPSKARWGGQAVPEETFVSFIVIAYNEVANIARTLAAITDLEDLGEHEVIVVDDGSRDSTVQIVSELAEQNPCVRLIALAENR